MASSEVNWRGRWESERDALEFDKFIEKLVAAAPEHIRVVRQSGVVNDLLFDPVGMIDTERLHPELVAMETGGDVLTRGPERGSVSMERITLRGYEIGLFDWKHMVRFSFQSVNEPTINFLDGLLVQVRTESESSAHSRLSRPSVVLRYILEGWVDRLLAATKLFFMPALVYFHNGYMPGYEDLLAATQTTPGWRGMPRSEREREELRIRVLAGVIDELAVDATSSSGSLADFDRREARTANFVSELRAGGLSVEDAEYVIASKADPDFVDLFLSRSSAGSKPRDLHDLVAILREAGEVRHETYPMVPDFRFSPEDEEVN